MTTARCTLILGGVRSGKSRLAERIALDSGMEVVYIATATAMDDAEMRERIAAHRERRPAPWLTVEEPVQLAARLREHCVPHRCVVVDCLMLWLTNLLCAGNPSQLVGERETLIEALPTLRGRVILVSNETGLGVVPLGALSRRFIDEAGDLHRRLAQCCDQVIFTVAGLPQVLKGSPL
ncbi:MAG: bifunctional adenosylcobinamide kinase/adenosylcobinamide-phosphate guanylyltransferase [Panacagrimonas sp.]